ncbi:MAG: FecR domain-containing protein [Polaribacter sp.]
MNSKNIEELIIRFVECKATLEEQVELRDLLKIEENRIYFEEYVELHYLLNSKINFNYKKSLKEITRKIQLSPKKIYTHNLFKYAAAIIILITVGYFTIKTPAVKIEEPIVVGTDKAILTLEDGTTVALEKGKNYKSKIINSNGEKITYTSETNTFSKEVAYNYLTVPRGGQFFIELEDGTKVWLNSESKLKYPVNFYDNQTRKVELVYGEAYFDVSPSTNHKGSSFIVNTEMQNVTVLGTEFNIKAYKDELETQTTLIEGSIVVANAINGRIIKPGQQSKISTTNNKFEVSEVDVDDVIAWRDGMFSFTNKPLDEIMVVLSRWYNVDITIPDAEIQKIKFNGMLSKKKSLINVIEEVKTAIDIEYSFNNRNLIIKKRK